MGAVGQGNHKTTNTHVSAKFALSGPSAIAGECHGCEAKDRERERERERFEATSCREKATFVRRRTLLLLGTPHRHLTGIVTWTLEFDTNVHMALPAVLDAWYAARAPLHFAQPHEFPRTDTRFFPSPFPTYGQ